MSTKYNVGWLKDEQNQIFIPFTYAKSVKLDNKSGLTLQTTVNTVGEHTTQLQNQSDRIKALENGTKPAGTASKTVGKLTVGDSNFDGSKDVTITAKDLGITGALVYRGISTTQITNGGNELPKINDEYIALSDLDAGNIVLYKTEDGVIYQEFVWTGKAWELLGDEGSYALKTIEIVAGDGLINGGSGNTTLRDNIEIKVNPDGLTITTLNDQIALKIIDPEVTNEDIIIDTNGTKIFTLPSIAVDKYGRVTKITNKTIKLNDVTDKINTLINNVSGLESSLKTVIDDIAGDSAQNDKIVPRINTLETRTKYLYAADDKDTAFAIADGKGGVVFEVQPDGTTKGIDFKTKLGHTVNNNAQNIADNASGIVRNTSSIGSIQTTLNSHSSILTNYGNSISANTTSIGNINNSISNINTTLSNHSSILTNYGNSISANATAIRTKANNAITITGDGTTTDGGGNLQSNRVISLKSIYSSAQYWGPSIASFPAFGASFTVPQITVDQYGRVTEAFNRAITLPSVSDLENGIAANVSAIGSINSSISSINTKITSINSSISTMRGLITSNTSALATKVNINDYNNKISELTTSIKNNTDQLAINATRFDSNDNELLTIRTNDNLQNEAINTMLERIGDTEMRTQYIHPNPSPLNSNAFAICDGDGDIALEVQTDGKTRGFDFITVDGNSVNENEARIEALEGKLQNITVQSASGNATAFIDSISQNNEGTIIATKKNIPVFNGATNQNNGTSGLVTKPLRADRTKFLCGDGTWKTVSTDDKKVNQTSSRNNKNYPLLISTNENPNGQDLSAYYNSGVTMNPSTKEIIANNFKGGLNTNGKNIQLTENVNYGTSITSANDGILVFEEISGSLIPEDGTHGYVLTSNQGKPNWQENIAAGIQINPIENNRIYVTGTFDAQYLYYNNNVYIEDNVLMGAAWNDYAEYRICRDNYKAGQVVCENGDDTLSIATERLQPGAEIVSDTFGFAIGLTEEATCPIAVSGRVLAYTYEPRAEFSAGDAVCAGPNGTVSKMTREEIREYPERIIGTVSAIPNYETWNDKVIVNNRIWIKIK